MKKLEVLASKETSIKEIPIHDVHFAAFTFYHSLTPKLKKINNRIVFVYPPTQKFYELLGEYYKEQHNFNLAEYVDALKKAKSLMYAAKEGDSHES